MTRWTEHLKTFAKENKVTYKEAMFNEASLSLYKKNKPVVSEEEVANTKRLKLLKAKEKRAEQRKLKMDTTPVEPDMPPPTHPAPEPTPEPVKVKRPRAKRVAKPKAPKAPKAPKEPKAPKAPPTE